MKLHPKAQTEQQTHSQNQVKEQGNSHQGELAVVSNLSNLSLKIKKFQPDEFDQKLIVFCQFCGGEKCPQQNYLTNKIQPNAIQGLHSNWITDDILAMQRPSERIIKEFSLYKRFQSLGINTILNLQQPGEHPYCGDGIIPKIGFSYIPQKFFPYGIHFFNESWQDMTATTFQHMMKIMNIFDMSIRKKSGKIAVHCHAGRGRTLLVICAWLIYNDRMPAQKTIDLAVQKRQGVLTKSSQRRSLHDFQKQLRHRWKNFNTDYKNNFHQFVQWQSGSIVNSERRPLKWTPYLHGAVLAILRQRLKDSNYQIALTLLNTNDPIHKAQWNDSMEQKLSDCKRTINDYHTEFLKSVQTRILIELLYDFYDQMPYTVITSHTMDDITNQEFREGGFATEIEILQEPAIIHDVGIYGIAVMLDFVSFFNSLYGYLMDKDSKIIDLLYIRLAIMLFTKRKYNPKLFNIKTRSCNLHQHSKHKYINLKIVALSKFLRNLSAQIPEESQSFQSLILKFRRVDANIFHFTENHRKQNKNYLAEHTKDIYERSKLQENKSRLEQMKSKALQGKQQFLQQESKIKPPHLDQ